MNDRLELEVKRYTIAPGEYKGFYISPHTLMLFIHSISFTHWPRSAERGIGSIMNLILTRRRLASLLTTAISTAGISTAGIAGTGILMAPRSGHARTILQIGDQKGGMRSLMQAAGVLTDLPYDIGWVQFAGAPMLLQAMNANAVDVGSVGDAPLAFTLAGGNPIRAIAAERTDGASTALIVRAGSPVHDLHDLRGKSVATLHGQTGHYLVLAALRQAGLRPSDVDFVFIPPVAAKVALQNGSVDSWASWGPYISQAKIVDGAREIINGRHLMSGLSFLTATLAAIAGKHAEIADLIARLRQAELWARANPDAYAATWAREIGFPVAVARDVITHLMASIIPIDPDVVAAQQQVADFMHENALLPARLDAGAGFDRSFRQS